MVLGLQKELLTQAAACVNPEGVQVKWARHRRTGPVRFHWHAVPSVVRITETGSGTVAARPGAGTVGRSCLIGAVSVLQNEGFWRRLMVIQQCECTQYHCSVHFNMDKVVNFVICI